MNATSTRRSLRAAVAIAATAAVLTLTGCGGGDVTFDIGVLIGGQPGGTVIQSGQTQRLYLPAGQSLQLDASEAVQWTLEVGGSAVTGTGTTVSYQGVNITVTALSASRIALDTYAPYSLLSPVPIRLTAVSTFDSALVATVDVLITN